MNAMPFKYDLSWSQLFCWNFSPAGWDNEKKIAILNENLHAVKPDQYYTDVIARPIVRAARSTNRELEVPLATNS